MLVLLAAVWVVVAFCLPDRLLALLTFFESRRLPFDGRDDESVRFRLDVDVADPSPPPVDTEDLRCFVEPGFAFDCLADGLAADGVADSGEFVLEWLAPASAM